MHVEIELKTEVMVSEESSRDGDSWAGFRLDQTFFFGCSRGDLLETNSARLALQALRLYDLVVFKVDVGYMRSEAVGTH